ncbi:hypothetical protein ACEWY4_022285 [Coilia grayii]|uniref:Ig-like domain-containing protein n=1 Tax=Coilia grayii TaxID=363190 RepID=A0ABD1J5P7_9TELE
MMSFHCRYGIRKISSQQLVLQASPVALAFTAARGPQATGVRAKKPEDMEKEVRARVVSEGGDPGNATLVLSCHSIQFGKYQGQTFKWLLENDAGYAIQLVHSHQRERETNTMTSPLMANKDALAQYSCAHQVFISHLKFHRAHEEAWARASQPGREAEALVGFGQFKGDTLKDLYESTDKDHQGFVKWLRRKTPQPVTAMDAARKYILRQDAKRPAATAAGSSSCGQQQHQHHHHCWCFLVPPLPHQQHQHCCYPGVGRSCCLGLTGSASHGPRRAADQGQKDDDHHHTTACSSRPQRGQPPSVPPPPSVDVTDEELVQAALGVELGPTGCGSPTPGGRASTTTTSGTVSSSSSIGCSTHACFRSSSHSAAGGDPGASSRLHVGDAVGGGHPAPSAGAEEEEAEGEARGAANIVRSCCG